MDRTDPAAAGFCAGLFDGLATREREPRAAAALSHLPVRYIEQTQPGAPFTRDSFD